MHQSRLVTMLFLVWVARLCGQDCPSRYTSWVAPEMSAPSGLCAARSLEDYGVLFKVRDHALLPSDAAVARIFGLELHPELDDSIRDSNLKRGRDAVLPLQRE